MAATNGLDWKDQLRKDLIRHEGLRLKAYKDSVGKVTIGVGRCDPSLRMGMSITNELAMEWFEEDLKEAIDDARYVCHRFDDLDGVRKGVVTNLAFNMGRGTLSTFKRTLRAIEAGDYSNAALYMLQSKWATQVGQRSKELAKRMASGKI